MLLFRTASAGEEPAVCRCQRRDRVPLRGLSRRSSCCKRQRFGCRDGKSRKAAIPTDQKLLGYQQAGHAQIRETDDVDVQLSLILCCAARSRSS